MVQRSNQPIPTIFQAIEPTALSFLTFAPQAMVGDVIARMAMARVNCALVLNSAGQVTGLLSQADLIRVSADGHDLATTPIGTVITPGIVCITATEAIDPVRVLEVFQRFPIEYLPILSDDGDVIRVINAAEAQQQGQPIARLRLQTVQQVLNPQILQANAQQTLQQIAQLFSRHNQRCAAIVATDSSDTISIQPATPIGVITRSDLIQAQRLGWDFAHTTVEQAMSDPPRLIGLENNLWEAYELMQQYLVEQLIVVNQQGNLVGSISRDRLLHCLDAMDLWQTLSALQSQHTEQTLALEAAHYQQKHQAFEQQRLQQELWQTQQELARLVQLDPLTQIANRRHFDQLLAQEWQRLRREQLPLAVILADIDYFQEYNQHFGSPTGDRTLQQLTAVFSNSIPRSSDWVARYDGDAFAFLLPYTEVDGAQQLVQRLHQAIAALAIRHPASSCSNYVTLSFGIATCLPSRGDSFAELLTATDRALYRAKQEGRNCCRVATRTENTQSPKFQIHNFDYAHQSDRLTHSITNHQQT
jgi:diguanylate cyclase (GGDEF)-like protein